MSDVDLVMNAMARVQLACRPRRVANAQEAAGVSAHQAHILQQLDPEDPAMVGELAESMGVTLSTMSLNLKRLREAGLVACERDPEDHRVMNVRLTEAGDRARSALRPLDVDRLDAALRAMRPEQPRHALEGLTALADAADAVLTWSDSET